jgi:hypothetical protein
VVSVGSSAGDMDRPDRPVRVRLIGREGGDEMWGTDGREVVILRP